MDRLSIGRAVLLALALLPALYVLVAIQHGAVDVPYWDHTELIRMIEAYKTGNFSLEQLWAPHNHSRPLLYRLLYLPNALLTDWDVRSEYVYMYAAIYGAFAVHAWILYTNREKRLDAGFYAGLALVSLVYFSPVGHMNHWWSMMLQLQLGNLLILLALWLIARRPGEWRANILAAIACWLATYTITNGIFAFAVSAMIVALSADVRHNAAKLAFWAASIALMLAVYLPGLPAEPDAPFVASGFVGFIAVYLGLPLGGLLDFQYTGPFSHPTATALNAVCGILLSLCTLWVLYRRRAELRSASAAYRFLLACAGFAALSALVTAEGRSDGGAAYANSSRYAIYSSYVLLGLLHYYAWTIGGRHVASDMMQGGVADRHDMSRIGMALAMAVMACLGLTAYWKGIAVYRGAHAFNDQLVAVYNNPAATDQDVALMYPDVAFARHVRDTLSRYSLGPYRFKTARAERLAETTQFTEAIRLENSIVLRQSFRASHDGLNVLELQFVTWQTSAPAAAIQWSLYELAGGRLVVVGGGRIDTVDVMDWDYRRLQVTRQAHSAGREYELVIEAPPQLLGANLIGVPLFGSAQAQRLRLQSRAGRTLATNGTLSVTLKYGD